MSNPVQTKVGAWNGGATTVATTFTSLPAAGDAVTVAIRAYSGGAGVSVSSVVDNQTGNTFVKISSGSDTANNGQLELWWCSSITAPSGSYTVTATLSAANQARLDLMEYGSGLSLDKTGSNTATGTTGTVTASGANTSTTNSVVAAICASYDAGSAISDPTGYTPFVNDTGFVNFVDTNISYKTEVATVTSSASGWAWTNSQAYIALIATFKSSGGGSSFPPVPESLLTKAQLNTLLTM